jgi:hypothetical protein
MQGNPCRIASSASPKSVMNSPRSTTRISFWHSGLAQTVEPYYMSSAVTSQIPQKNPSTSPPGMPLASKRSGLFSCRIAPRWPLAVVGGCQPRQSTRVQGGVLDVTRRGRSSDHNESWLLPAMTRVITTIMLVTLMRS